MPSKNDILQDIQKGYVVGTSVAKIRFGFPSEATVRLTDLTQGYDLPLPPESRQSRPARKQLLHRGLFDGPLLGDQRFQRSDQLVNVGEDGGDGALFLCATRDWYRLVQNV